MGKQISGAQTPFNDKDGNVIKVHDYVKDAEGNRYYINSHCQAVPEGGDAPAKELSRLLEESTVSLMSIQEVLNMKEPVATRRRGGRRKKEDPTKAIEQAKVEAQAAAAEKAARELAEREAAEAAKKAAALAAQEGTQDLHPVTQDMILVCLPDDMLANELRRRGYTLCAVRPALIEL